MRLRSVFVESRVARRMLALFVLCTLVPLLLSDWLATAAVSQVARDLLQRHQVQATRQTSLQVFDRLAAAKALLSSLPESLPPAEFAPPPASLPMFAGLAWLDERGHAAFARSPERSLVAAWHRGGRSNRLDGAAATDVADDTLRVVLRVVPEAARAPRLLLGASTHGRLRWLAELQPSYVWAPLADAAIDSVWRVSDAEHRLLAERGDAAAVGASDLLSHSTRLFLAAEFGAGDWEFSEERPMPPVDWHGLPLAAWLALATAATVLVSALLSLGQIRRTLVPLQRLTSGARALASGTNTTRVDIAGHDEFAQLGCAFNEMAERIDGQIDSLEMLSLIDADVLSGTPIDVVARLVLERLGNAHPQVAAAIHWLDPRQPCCLHGVQRNAGNGAAVSYAMRAIDAGALDALASAANAAPPAPAVAGNLLLGASEGDLEWTLALAWQGDTRGVLRLRLPPELADSLHGLARELQARLAVAFSARERESEMNHRAAHDGLTGLANRHGLNEFVDAMLHQSPDGPAAILFIDLDHFKDANDSLGHEAGDRVLAEAGRRLLDCAPPGSLVARQGGDEFVLALPRSTAAQARDAASSVVRRLGHPFELAEELHTFGASVGVALFPDHGTSRVELMRHADTAMYAAKAGGRGRFHLFDESLEAASHERLRLPAELRRAVERGELVAYYQPRMSTISGRVTSVEALVRWEHPQRGLLMPNDFIALAEESQLIEDIGLFMLEDACSRIGAWQCNGAGVLRVSVNVSPRQLVSGRLPEQVMSILSRHHLPAHALELEVTESLLVADATGARAQLAQLRSSGVTIALDDFGTGYSSMSMLRNLPIDVMKIDRAFVQDLGVDESARAITRAIATLARELRLHLVAEGVETRQQAAFLEEMGCDEIQGFLYSRALPAATFDAYLRESLRDVRLTKAAA